MATKVSSFEELRRQSIAILEPLCENYLFPPSSEEPAEESELKLKKNFLKEYISKEAEIAGDSTWQSAELSELQKCSKESQDILQQLQDSRKSLANLMTRYQSVAEKTSSLHEACEELMADQTRLASAAEDIRIKLRNFDHVDQIVQKLSSPMLSVTGEAFVHMLATIDECMHFLRTESDYKESAAYLSKYLQCLSRALSLVRSHIVQNLSAAKTTITEKIQTDPNAEDSFTLYYGMFGAHAQSIHGVMEMLEQKWDRHQEYQSVLTDCYAAYFSTRDSLLRPSVNKTVQEMLKKHSRSCCTLTRTGCSFLLRLCEDEYRLFFQFFTRPSDLLHDFTERMCRIFHDAVRPLVIHTPHLETLTELCSILKIEILEEKCTVDSDLFAGFVRVASELLGDVGERLVYRAHMYAQSDILGYNPAPGDLAYPEKLQMMQEIARDNSGEAQAGLLRHMRQSSVGSVGSSTSAEVAGLTDGAEQHRKVSAADLHGLWYPTVRRTVLCLSKLYRCLDLAVFQGLCQDILALCVQSLFSAKTKITATKKPLDAQLFLVKHLLILREQTSPFRTGMSIKETSIDFSKIRDSAMNFMQHKSRWFALGSNNAFLELIFQVPAHVSEQVVDTRRVLDLQLRDACQTLINDSPNTIVLELKDFIQKAEVIAEMSKSGEEGSGAPVALRQQLFAAAEAVQKLAAQSFRKTKDQIPLLRAALALYIGNRDTENILFAPIRKNIQTSFQKLAELVKTQYSEEEAQVIGLPTQEQIHLILAHEPSD